MGKREDVFPIHPICGYAVSDLAPQSGVAHRDIKRLYAVFHHLAASVEVPTRVVDPKDIIRIGGEIDSRPISDLDCLAFQVDVSGNGCKRKLNRVAAMLIQRDDRNGFVTRRRAALASLFPRRSGVRQIREILFVQQRIFSTSSWRLATLNSSDLSQVTRQPQRYEQFVLAYLGAYHTIMLNGTARLHLTDIQDSGDLISEAHNTLMRLFQDSAKRHQLRSMILDSLKLHYVIDPTQMTKLRIRLSTRAPVDEAEEQSWDSRAREFHAQATDIQEASDGVKSFVGLLTAIVSSDAHMLLIDEPEAFLHPPLARKLGWHIAKQTVQSSANVFVATHSADFLMGCIESGVNVNILRLTYKHGVPSARLLKSDHLSNLMKDPLVRSTDFLNAIFYDGVVITEADADRAFYQEINYRLINEKSNGADDTLFINAQNKQTIWRLMEPLRDMGIPAAGIMDLDFLKDGGPSFSNTLRASKIPQLNHSGLGQMRGQLYAAFSSTGKEMKKDGGVHLLKENEKEACLEFIDQLAKYGLFVVPFGELESWLKNLGVQKRKSDWLIDIFDKMGSDPQSPEYIHPTDDDVWAFMRKVAAWINDPSRRGILTS